MVNQLSNVPEAVSDNFFPYKNAVLHFVKAGKGDKTLLIFHGFGQNAYVFQDFAEKHLAYTIYSFDLFFHGKSSWGYGEKPLEKAFWVSCMETFLATHGINRFAVAGFSLGARFALCLAEGFATRIDHIYLLAPDGIKTSLWYSLATYPVLLRKLFKSMIYHPNRFYSLAKTMEKLKLMDKGLIRFAESQMNTEEKRSRVYFAWVVFRHLVFSKPRLIQKINDHGISVTLILGEYDKVITIKNLKPFAKEVKKLKIVTLKTGHNGLIPMLNATGLPQ
ncbi:MAG TPA: alpha/beta hydrolase [Cyclobacteriaceae bacterium]|nr:alpha/beta hydrolase [Cyclobacteriaceae bacterium]HRJ82732.1 alpha/beta hydrolase [Cyclobacteriaceae bacterium]